MKLNQYRHVLRDPLNLPDDQWTFTIPNLPADKTTDQAGLMKSCCLTANDTKQNLVLSFIQIPSNRATAGHPLNHFVHLTCADFRLHTPDGKASTIRESAEYLSRFLKQGLTLNGVTYSFYGHSNSQLKSRSCFLMRGSQKDIDDQVEKLGDFSQMKTVAKKAKRIGLLFSTGQTVLIIDPARCRDISDIEQDGYIFTDGCGNISPALAKFLSQKTPLLFRNQRYHPSVFQIRYRGYKGVVVLNPLLPPAIWLEFRKSMRKFSGATDHSFAVVGVSKPYTYGYLNDEVILLLQALGIRRDVLEKKQNEYFDFLERACSDPRHAFNFLTSIESIDLAETVLLEGIEKTSKQVQKLVTQEHGRMLNKRNLQKCRIRIPKSRLLFGVCDPYGILQQGECFVRPTMDSDGLPHTLVGLSVLVARNPCLHPGDLQKLRAVNEPKLAHLIDCIIFPVNGRRPAADMMSGGDLDGDTFFVCWDHELIPFEIAQPAEYPAARESVQFTRITSHDRIDYFARSSNTQLGRTKNLFLKWARKKGPLSSECQELNRLFSQCVDASRITIPERLLEVSVSDAADKSYFILDVLHESARHRIRSFTRPASITYAPTEDALLEILNEPSGMSQYELAKLTLKWCQTHSVQFESFWQFFDHSLLSSEEKTWFTSHLPPQYDIPGIIHNDLMHSDILTNSEVTALGLHSAHMHWRRIYNSNDDRLANLLEVVERTFPVVTRKLLVLQIHERLSVAMYLPLPISPVDETSIGNGGRLFAFPHGQQSLRSTRVVVPTRHNACFYYDGQGFQLYEGKRQNTFVYLKRAVNDDSTYRTIEGKGNRARAREETIREGINHEWKASIALNKFSKGLALHVGRLWREGISAGEIYVISNADTRSFRNIDLWLEQVDTEKVYSNFAQDGEEVQTAAGLIDINWEQETDTVTAIVRDGKRQSLEQVAPTDIERALYLAWSTNNQDIASDVFSRWVQYHCKGPSNAVRGDAIGRLVGHLAYMPGLVIHFMRLAPWSDLEPSARHLLVDNAIQIIKALVWCAEKMGHLVVKHLITVLSEMSELSIGQLQEIVEMAALTISSVESAMDVLAEGFDTLASRILLLTPKNSQFLMNKLSAIVVNHIEEAADNAKNSRANDYEWCFGQPFQIRHNQALLTCDYRIDAPAMTRLVVGDHVRFRCAKAPPNINLSETSIFEPIVVKLEVGRVTFRCLRYPPAFYQRSTWSLKHCGSFVTAKTMIDAVTKLMTEKETCCGVFPALLGSVRQARLPVSPIVPPTDLLNLNPGQREALIKSLSSPLTCIWGPPGTGKTHTIVSIINSLLQSDKEKRLLVAAPTHTAVDNVLRQYLRHHPSPPCKLVRVSTDVRKVSADLRGYTCDAMLGKDLSEHTNARRKAQKEISRARIVFTTCIGAGLGLLKSERFENVIIDEASQQAESASFVPLVKGCSRVMLVGDHVQLRTTVQPNAAVLGFDVSLFERLWTENTTGGSMNSLQKVMLYTQYRMHPAICAFPSVQFYESKLETAAQCGRIPLPPSRFPWPSNDNRLVFVQISTTEDLGRQSKTNGGQAFACQKIVGQLRSSPSSKEAVPVATDYSIAILTPYSRQAELLKKELPGETISSIDGFQGQEADVVVYVSVRCNSHGDIGFLRDMRRLNVALTRARAGLIIIGDETTLTGGCNSPRHQNDEVDDSYGVWTKLVQACDRVSLDMEDPLRKKA